MKENYINIPYSVSSRKDLTQTQKFIYGFINGFKKGTCKASNAYIADILGMSASAVSKAISDLTATGDVVVDLTANRYRTLTVDGQDLTVDKQVTSPSTVTHIKEDNKEETKDKITVTVDESFISDDNTQTTEEMKISTVLNSAEERFKLDSTAIIEVKKQILALIAQDCDIDILQRMVLEDDYYSSWKGLFKKSTVERFVEFNVKKERKPQAYQTQHVREDQSKPIPLSEQYIIPTKEEATEEWEHSPEDAF